MELNVCDMYIQDETLDYECVLEIENQSVVVDASVEPDAMQPSVFLITCQPYQVRIYCFLVTTVLCISFLCL